MERALAHVEKILAVEPIPNADAIEVVQVLGWNVVVKKGEFKEGDMCVFFEIDSFLNSKDSRYATFEERFINWDGKRGMRLKTIKLRGQISQGLVLSISQFPEIKNPTEGLDVTELLKIEKWEAAEERASNGAGRTQGSGKSFPSFIQKTDQTRVQSVMPMLPRMLEEDFEATIKLDGSSTTAFAVHRHSPYFDAACALREKKVKGFFQKVLKAIKKKLGLEKRPDVITGICSRNLLLAESDDSHFTNTLKRDGVIEKLKSLGQNYALQGELVGPSIQQNHEKMGDYEYFIFDVFDIDRQVYLLPAAAREVCKFLGLKYVPVLDEKINLAQFIHVGTDLKSMVEHILNYAEGPGMNPGVRREGVVFKSNKSTTSFKAISNSYLLKKEKGIKE